MSTYDCQQLHSVTMATPTTARQRYARGEGERLRVDLLESAADLMAEHGNVAQVSLRKVAGRAGVSPTAVYRHFDDHTELLRESVLFCWTNFRNVLQEAKDSSDDPFVALRNAGDAYVRFAMESPGQYRVMFSNTIDVGLVSSDLGNSAGFSAFEILIDLVSAVLVARGDDRDAFFVAVQVHTWIHGIVHLCGNHPDIPWPPVSELLDGLVETLRLDAAP